MERYLEYKRRLNPDFSIPSTYPDSKHSEIYQGFKNRFGNKSGYIVSGVNWFLSGICNRVYNENLKVKIMDLVLLDRGISYWESFFKNKIG